MYARIDQEILYNGAVLFHFESGIYWKIEQNWNITIKVLMIGHIDYCRLNSIVYISLSQLCVRFCQCLIFSIR